MISARCYNYSCSTVTLTPQIGKFPSCIMPEKGNFTANPYSFQTAHSLNVGDSDGNVMTYDVLSGYTNIAAEKPPSDMVVKSPNPAVKSKPPKSAPTIVVNACLSFIYSERLRKDSPTVVEEVSKHFTLDEIKSAREALYRASGVGRYIYCPPVQPATAQQVASHCVSTIISKLNELDYNQNGMAIKIVCPAEEVFHLFNMLMMVYNPAQSTPLEDRVRALELKVNQMDSTQSANQRQSNAQSSTFTSRHKVINDIRNSNFPRTPQSAKRTRSIDDESWVDVSVKASAPKPPQKRIKPSFWGKADTVANSDLSGVEVHDVFLFNYRKIATEEVVRLHFEKHDIQIVKIYQRSRDGSDVKSFVVRLARKADFDKLVKVLPWQTGA